MYFRKIPILLLAAAVYPAIVTAQVNGKNQGYLVDPKFDVVTTVLEIVLHQVAPHPTGNFRTG